MAESNANSFRTVRKNTIQVAEGIPRAAKAQIIELLRAKGDDFAGWLETVTPEFSPKW